MTHLLDTNAISDLMRAAPRVENWIAGLDGGRSHRDMSDTKGEVLFGISRLPAGRRRTELGQTGRQFLAAFHCQSVPEQSGDLYAAVKLMRHQRGLALDENDLWIAATAPVLGATLVSRDGDFAGIQGLSVLALV